MTVKFLEASRLAAVSFKTPSKRVKFSDSGCFPLPDDGKGKKVSKPLDTCAPEGNTAGKKVSKPLDTCAPEGNRYCNAGYTT